MGGPSTKVLGPPPPLSQLTGDTKQRKGVIQHRAHLAGSSSTVVLGANRPQTARTLSGTVVRGGGGGEGAGQGEGGAKTQRWERRWQQQHHGQRPWQLDTRTEVGELLLQTASQEGW